MAVNKVVLGERTLIDLSFDTATEADVRKGKYFHRADGEIVEGTSEDSGGGGGGGGGDLLVESDVNFYDYDGTLLYAYPRVAALEMTELPEPPIHDGLTFQEWNWTLDGIKSVNDQEVIVGAIYTTDDGKTRLYIDIESDVQKRVKLCICANGSDKNVTVNWGDGTDETYDINTRQGTTNYYIAVPIHVYESTGEYVITLASASRELNLGYDSYSVFYQSGANGLDVVYQKILRKVELGDCIKYISPKAFYNCINLATITMHKGVTSINQRNSSAAVFGYCYSLKYVNLPKGIPLTYNFFKACGGMEIVSLSETGSLTDYQFDGCVSLSRLTIPPKLSRMGKYCLNGTSLTRIVLPETLSYVDEYGISSMKFLTEIVIKAERPNTWKSGAYNCHRLKTFQMPVSATTIQNKAFYMCKMLESVNIPDGVTSIGDDAFTTCINLTTIHLPDTVMSIGSSAFHNCHSLASVNIPDGVTSIHSSTFYYCCGLTSLEIPSSVTSIATKAFYVCNNMKYIDFSKHTSVPTLSNTDAFNGTPTGMEIRVPAALYDEWIAATNWSSSSIKSKIVAV